MPWPQEGSLDAAYHPIGVRMQNEQEAQDSEGGQAGGRAGKTEQLHQPVLDLRDGRWQHEQE